CLTTISRKHKNRPQTQSAKGFAGGLFSFLICATTTKNGLNTGFVFDGHKTPTRRVVRSNRIWRTKLNLSALSLENTERFF
ncbi:MAG: hypothetical protein RSA79_08210, partial [Oscillospiraceae bacterium]